jgi:glycosyltransferase involved in cell wall biosynthesis
MPKKNKNKGGGNMNVMNISIDEEKPIHEGNINEEKPFVSICTPTFNRRPFIPALFKCFMQQDYPKDRLEWIILDDGTDKVGDLVQEINIPQIKYFPLDDQLVLGKKRNLMHEKCKGDIILYFDDDDYYPPERVSHAVQTLQANPAALCVASSTLFMYFKHVDKIYQFGPYGPQHATAATMAFHRTLLKDHAYDNMAAIAEEKVFLKNYSVPLIQLDPKKTILVFAHDHNTFDKKLLLDNPNPTFVKETTLKVADFINDADLCDFYVQQLPELLRTYDPGSKPEVTRQMKQLLDQRQQQQQKEKEKTIMIKQGDGPAQPLTMEQITKILQQQHAQIMHLNQLLQGKETEIQLLTSQVAFLTK